MSKSKENTIKIDNPTLIVAKMLGEDEIIAKTVGEEDIDDVVRRNTIGSMPIGDENGTTKD